MSNAAEAAPNAVQDFSRAVDERPRKGERFESDNVERLIKSAIDDRLTPGMVVSVYQFGVPLFRHATGQLAFQDEKRHPVKSHTVYDIGSLTIPLITVPMLIRLAGMGRFRLEDRVSRHLQNFGVNGKGKITVGQILSHAAGYPDYYAFYEELRRENSGSRLGILTSRGAREFVINSIQRGETSYEAGSRTVPSQLSYMLAGALVETLSAQPLERAVVQLVTSPLGMKSTGFIDVELLKRRQVGILMEMVAPTGKCSWRGREMWGEVSDENCWAMGGIAGHSGIFSCAEDLQIVANELLRGLKGGSEYFQARPTREFLLEGEKHLADEMHRGFAPAQSRFFELGTPAKPGVVGLGSDTGCSVLLDPDRQLSVILLANPKHVSANLRKYTEWRKSLHEAIGKAV